MKEKIELYAEIDMSVIPNETRVKPVKGDPWADLGYWLEVTGFMAYRGMKVRDWSAEQMANYCKEYIEKCLDDYKMKLPPLN